MIKFREKLIDKAIDSYHSNEKEMEKMLELNKRPYSPTQHEKDLCNKLLDFAKKNKIKITQFNDGFEDGGGRIQRIDDPSDYYETPKAKKICEKAFKEGYIAVISWTNSKFTMLAHELGHFISWKKKKDNKGIVGLLGKNLDYPDEKEWENPNLLSLGKGYLVTKNIYNNESNADKYGAKLLKELGATENDIKKFWEYSNSEHFYKPQYKKMVAGLGGKMLLKM